MILPAARQVSGLLAAATAVVLSLSVAALSAADGVPSNPWRQLALDDLAAVRRFVLENHPGPVDAVNPDFATRLEADFTAASRMAERAAGYEDWLLALRSYAASFQDGHLEFAESVSRRTLRWPGFFVIYAGNGRYRMAVPPRGDGGGSDDDGLLPPASAELLSCDGHPLPGMMAGDVLPYFGIRDLEASRYRYAPRLLVDEANPTRPAPAVCRVKVGDEEKEYPLRWQTIPQADLAAKRRLVSRGARAKSSLEVAADGGAWLRLSDFNPSEADARDLHALISRLTDLRHCPYIVFDLRGNDGGSSAWGAEVIGTFFGAETLSRLLARDHSRVDWRASPGNLAYLRDLLPRLRRDFGVENPLVISFTRTVEGMAAALTRGESFYAEPADHPIREEDGRPTGVPDKLPTAYRGKVFLLTDAWDASAALDFCDLLLGIEGVIHVGQPTYADSVYLDARGPLALPSGLGELYLPMKVFRDRARANNQPYVPSRSWEGDITDTAALKAWVSTLVPKAVPSPTRGGSEAIR